MSRVIFPLFFVFVALSGCSLNTYVSNNRFDYPETHGEWLWGRTQFRYQGTTRIEPVPVQQSSQEPFSVNTFTVSADVGISKRFDLYLKMPFAPSPTLLGLKYQFLGNSYDKRQQGDWALAMTVGGGYGRRDADGEYKGEPSKLRGTSLAGDTAVIVGFRPGKDLMIYGGPFYFSFKTEGQMAQTNATFDVAGQGEQIGMNLGLLYGLDGSAVALEVAQVNMTWTGSETLKKSHVGLAMSKEF